MSFAPYSAVSANRAASPDLANRRLAGGLLLSLVFHALLLMLQFGVPGVGLPSPFKPPPLSIAMVPPAPPLPALAAPSLENLAPLLPPLNPKPVASGMRLVDPPPVAPKPGRAKAAKPAKAPKPVKPRKVRPLPQRAPVPPPTRVIAQDQNLNDSFVVPLPQPDEPVQKAADLEPAQPKSAQEPEAEAQQKQALAKEAEAEARLEQQERLLAQQRAEENSRRQAEEQGRRQAELLRQREQEREQKVSERAARQQVEQQQIEQKLVEQQRVEQQRVEQQQIEQQQIEQARQRADEQARTRLAQQQADRAAAKQQIDELALKQKTDELALRQRAEELALKQKADEQAARQQAEQAARQQAEQAAEAAAAGQRERERSAAAAAGAGTPGAGLGGSGATVPKNLLGSDAGNRVRELTRGIDLLQGAPPRGDQRGGRRMVAGGAERDVPLRMYVESFRQKVERNGGQGFTSQDGDRVRIDPLVSVALRSDGSVEDVTIVRSSGNADTDNAVRRIIRLNARYSAFPPNIADRYDVIEVRRIWSFAETLKLLEELR